MSGGMALCSSINHFTVVCLVAKPLLGGEACVDFIWTVLNVDIVFVGPMW